MLRLQRMIKALPWMVILLIVMAAAVNYLFPALSDADSRPLSLIPLDRQQSQTYMVVPGSIHDGDTLQVANGKGELEIRLCGIDSPEIEQPMGSTARDHLSRLIDKGDGTVVVMPVAHGRNHLTVAELFVKPSAGQGYHVGEEIAVNAQMVADGYAYHDIRASEICPNGQVLSQLEAMAQEQGLGVWQDAEAVRPSEFRKSN